MRRCIGFGYGLAARLRGQDMVEAVRPWVQQDELDTLAGCRNVPDALLMSINRDLAACLRRGELTDILYQALTQRVVATCSGWRCRTATRRSAATSPSGAKRSRRSARR